ncbi:MAG: histidine kinase [Prolixibacteraceae bacterium]|nr:histidine kinase [Prolixibacteraceae bacterium]
MKQIICGILLLCLSGLALAQFPFSIHYTVEDGLPGSTVLDIAQDTSGFIWTAGTYGISRFDGYSFENYYVDGIQDQSFILIFNGKNGKLWFLSYMGYLCYSQGDNIIPYSLNDTIRHLACDGFYKTLVVDTTDQIWFRSAVENQIICMKDSLVIRIDTVQDVDVFHPPLFKDFYPERNSSPLTGRFWISSDKEELYFFDKKVYVLSKGNTLEYRGNYDPARHSDVNGFDICRESNGNVWLRKNLIGSILYKNGNLENPQVYLEKQRVTRIFKDRERNYWFSTEDNGIFLVPSNQFNTYSFCCNTLPNDNIMDFDIRGNTIVFSTSDGNLYSANIQGERIFYIHEFIKDDKKLYGRDILFDSGNFIWIAQSDYLRYSLEGFPAQPDFTDIEKPYEIVQCGDGSVAIASYKGFYIFKNGKLVYDSRNDRFDLHLLSITEDEAGVLWLGAVDGLYCYDGKEFRNMADRFPFLSEWITSVQASEGKVWAGTREQGIGLLTNDSLIVIDESSGLGSNNIRCLYYQPGKAIWAGTNRGISKIKTYDGQGQTYAIDNYTIWNGLPSNEVNQIKHHRGSLWVATNSGFACFPDSGLTKSGVPPSLFIDKIRINGRDTTLNSDFRLNYNQNNIFISYTGISFKNPGNILYSTKLEGLSNDWTETQNRSVEYFNLLPGRYSFYLKATNIEVESTLIEKEITFYIKEHFTKTTWFLILLLTTITAIVAAIFLSVFKIEKNRSELNRAILEAEQKALRTQMNPHFIFNSLNSIQYFILDKDDENADLYLADFSSLMRKILENSKQNFITLQNELETIRLYLSLENLRFENKFEYAVSLDEEIDPEAIRIPPMLLQPYLENAIWHGLMQKEGKGKIDIGIRIQDGKYLVIILKDNGIGREKAAELTARREGHRSTGIKNIEERIALINRIYKTDMSVQITDLYSPGNIPAGTLVELTIPYISFL